MNPAPDGVAVRLKEIQSRIEEAARKAGRRAEEVTLIGVSKTKPAEAIRDAFEAGLRDFGESRVQEWEGKAQALADLPITLHLVGHLQRNKATRAAALFQAIDSLDSLPLAERLERARDAGTPLPVLIEVRLDPGATKTGCNPEDLPRLAEGVLLMPHLQLRGLMTVPPIGKQAEESRPHFSRLRELRDQLSAKIGRLLPDLSMGMSQDFEVAVEEGATQVRVGTALFGNRPREK